MEFREAVETVVLKKYATLEGRATRSEYWWFALAYVTLLFCALIADGILQTPIAYQWMRVFTFLIWLAMLVPSIAVGVRRFHDLGKSGWWILIGCVPLVGLVIQLYMFSRLGTPGPNLYGPDPLWRESHREHAT